MKHTSAFQQEFEQELELLVCQVILVLQYEFSKVEPFSA